VLDQFQTYLSDNPPSSILAKSFLSRWSRSKPATLYKYLSIIRGLLSWYGEDIDLKVRLAHQLPEYVEDDSVQRLIDAVQKKRTHKGTIRRDILLIKLAYGSGLRREELANLKVSDVLIGEKAVIVRKGKGMKDRTVPLPSGVVGLLQTHMVDMNPDERVFNVGSAAISDKIRRIARSAGVNIHTHSLRHGYATRLLERGANIKAVQELLGHSRIGTTEAYLSLLPKHLRETVDLLDTSNEKREKSMNNDNKAQFPAGLEPVVTIRDISQTSSLDSNVLGREYFSHFLIVNEGHGPALQVEMALLDDRQESLDIQRETILRSSESIEFRPVLLRPEGRYYILCRYRQVSSQDVDAVWAQTRLSFNLIEASRKGEVYVVPGELGFEFGIAEQDKIRIFPE
jgi:integrase/recombinase XerD